MPCKCCPLQTFGPLGNLVTIRIQCIIPFQNSECGRCWSGFHLFDGLQFHSCWISHLSFETTFPRRKTPSVLKRSWSIVVLECCLFLWHAHSFHSCLFGCIDNGYLRRASVYVWTQFCGHFSDSVPVWVRTLLFDVVTTAKRTFGFVRDKGRD